MTGPRCRRLGSKFEQRRFQAASTQAADELYQTFTLRGLSRGAHTVRLEVVSGTLTVDAVGVVP